MEDKKLGIHWEPTKVKVDDLKEWSKNPRKLTEDKYKKLVESIQKRGFHDVLKVDQDLTIISGHQRRRALKQLGVKEVWVLFPERPLIEEEKEIISIESNKQAGTFDFDALANTFDFENLLEAGFEDFELGFATTAEEDGTDQNTLEDSMETYLQANMKQLVFYFASEEYEDIIPRLDTIMTERELKSHTDVFLKLLETYENHRS